MIKKIIQLLILTIVCLISLVTHPSTQDKKIYNTTYVGTSTFAIALDNTIETQIEPDNSSLLGDVNGDGSITNSDVLKIYRYIYNPSLYPLDVTLADVNLDGAVTNADVLKIFRYIYNHELYPIKTICQHVFDKWIIVDNADCINEGTKERTCIKCLMSILISASVSGS